MAAENRDGSLVPERSENGFFHPAGRVYRFTILLFISLLVI